MRDDEDLEDDELDDEDCDEEDEDEDPQLMELAYKPIGPTDGGLALKVTLGFLVVMFAALPPLYNYLAGPEVEFTIRPAPFDYGPDALVTWRARNASSCRAGGAWSGDKPISGSELLSPQEDSTYTLECRGTDGITRTVREVGVRVTSKQ